MRSLNSITFYQKRFGRTSHCGNSTLTLLIDTILITIFSDIPTSTEALSRIGQEYLSQTYGENTEGVLSLLSEIYPDLGLPFASLPTSAFS
jgi:hypothetical protein